jgi:hypothetical protein
MALSDDGSRLMVIGQPACYAAKKINPALLYENRVSQKINHSVSLFAAVKLIEYTQRNTTADFSKSRSQQIFL